MLRLERSLNAKGRGGVRQVLARGGEEGAGDRRRRRGGGGETRRGHQARRGQASKRQFGGFIPNPFCTFYQRNYSCRFKVYEIDTLDGATLGAIILVC